MLNPCLPDLPPLIWRSPARRTELSVSQEEDTYLPAWFEQRSSAIRGIIKNTKRYNVRGRRPPCEGGTIIIIKQLLLWTYYFHSCYYIIILFLCTGKLAITVRTDELLGVHTICCRHTIKTIYLVNTIAANQRSQMLHLLSPHSDIVNVMESPKICCRKPSTTITDL